MPVPSMCGGSSIYIYIDVYVYVYVNANINIYVDATIVYLQMVNMSIYRCLYICVLDALGFSSPFLCF